MCYYSPQNIFQQKNIQGQIQELKISDNPDAAQDYFCELDGLEASGDNDWDDEDFDAYDVSLFDLLFFCLSKHNFICKCFRLIVLNQNLNF